MSNKNLNWANKIINVLYNLGIEYACICPGSRNSPLTYAITSSNIKCFSHIDERSASFFALGISKKTKKPAIVISTSGTATANFFPAIIEANYSKTPLIIITADRPKEILKTGANQTIEQKNMFGGNVKVYSNIDSSNMKLNELDNLLFEIVTYSNGYSDPPGPVHINIPFTEPLVSNIQKMKWNKKTITTVKKEIKRKKNKYTVNNDTLIICGPNMYSDIYNKKIILLSEHLKAPILADPCSNIRIGKSPNIISRYNYFKKKNNSKFQSIIRFGSKPVSKYLNFLIDNNDTYLIDPFNRFNDDADKIIHLDYKSFCDNVINNNNSISSSSTFENFMKLEKKVNEQLNNKDIIELECEDNLISLLFKNSKKIDNIFIGNSKLVRSLDNRMPSSNNKTKIFSNRGASGIDGIVSSGLGMSLVNNKKNNLILLGDLSLYHDMNGLLAGSRYDLNATILVVNNNGGGIFNSLDIAKLNIPQFEEYWKTPHNIDFKKVSSLYKCKYFQTDKIKNIPKLINKSFNIKGLKLIELKIDAEKATKNEQKIYDLII